MKVSSIEDYLVKIEPYLIDIINKHKYGWKYQLSAEITVSSVGDEDSKKSYHIYMRSKSLKVYDGCLTGMVVDDLLKSFLDDYQFSLRTKMKKSNHTYDRVRVFYYKLHKISINRGGGSYIIAQDWIKHKKSNNKSNK